MQLRRCVTRILCALMLLLTAAQSALPTASAQDIIIDPPLPPAPIAVWPIAVELQSVDAVVDGPLATVTVKQVFRNDSSRVVEGVYLFPLPEDAGVSDFQMTIDGKVIEGKLLDRDEARRIYEQIVRSQRDPALLEYMGRGLFQTSVFPIPAGARRTLELTYTQVLPQENGLRHFVVPLRSQSSNARPPEALAITVELVNQPGLRTLYSPSHNLAIERTGDDGATASFESSSADPARAFELYFGVDDAAIGANLLTYKPIDDDGFFLLLVAPTMRSVEDEVIERDIVLVLDVSGSMQGEKIGQARSAVQYVVNHLNVGDRFNLITFSSGTRLWQKSLQPATPTTVRDASRWIDRITATGSTDINRALLEAVAQIKDGDGTRPAYVLFMTDGLPTQGVTDAQRILDNALDNLPQERTVRLFSFGVGYDVNTDLLDTLSQEVGGRSAYVKPSEQIDEVVGDFYTQIGKPVLSQVALDFGDNMLVDEIYPYPLPDLFAGEQLVVVGRYRRGGRADLSLTGSVNGKETTYLYPNQELATSSGEPFVARLWATRKIGSLLYEIRRNGDDPELVNAIVDLSLQYGIVTPYTSYLVLEPGIVAAQPDAPASIDSEPVDMRTQARESVAGMAAAAASAPASGESAVESAKARADVANAVSVVERSEVRYVNGKSFVRQGYVTDASGRLSELWVDTRYTDSMKTETVQFASTRYFELLRKPDLTQWLAISPELVIVLGNNTALRITGAAK